MPIYCFTRTDTNEPVEVFMTYSAFDESKTRNGTHHIVVGGSGIEAIHDFRKQLGGFKNTPGNWPMASDAAGVGHDQVEEAVSADKKAGIRETNYTGDGRPIFRSPMHRREYCEGHGLFDRNGGDSDPRRFNG